MWHVVDEVYDVVHMIDACVECFERSIIVELVGATIIIAHILLPSEEAIHGSYGVRPRRVAHVALLRRTSGVNIIVEDVDKSVSAGRNTFVHDITFEINIAHQQFVEILHGLCDYAILRILIEKVVAACSA